MKAAIWFLLAITAMQAQIRFATTPEGKVRYQNWGAGDKALVFVHGWTCSGAFWKTNVEGLKDKWRVITVDLPGHGGSDKPEIAYTMPLMAKGVKAVMKDAGVRQAVLIGHSMGSPVIRHVYADVPASVAALVIVDGSIAKRNAPAQDRSRMYKAMREDYRGSMTSSIVGMFSAKTSPELRKQILDDMISTPQHVAISALEGLYSTPIWSGDAVGVPTLAIYKAPRTDELLRTQFSNLDFEMWEGYGHFLMMEDPERFNARLRHFLAKIGF